MTNTKRKPQTPVRSTRLVRRLEVGVIAAARRSAREITRAHRGDESNIADENKLVEAVEALDKAMSKQPNH
jgi:hypothetical protein